MNHLHLNFFVPSFFARAARRVSQALGAFILSLLALDLSLAQAQPTPGRPSIFQGLSANDQSLLRQGRQLTPEPVRIPGSAWPRIRVLQRSENSVSEVAAVFADFDRHIDYNPGLSRSRLVQTQGAQLTVDYTMNFPTIMGFNFGSENYTVLNRVSAYSFASIPSNAIRVDWNLVRADRIRHFDGFVIIEPIPDSAGGGTLVDCTNWIDPPLPAITRHLVSMAVEKTQVLVSSLITRTQALKTSQPGLLSQEIEALQNLLPRP